MNTPKKHHGILFKAEMIRALLSGGETMTRRLVKSPMPLDGWVFDRLIQRTHGGLDACFRQGNHGIRFIRCPLGAPGDGWYAKETFCCVPVEPTDTAIDPMGFIYRADGEDAFDRVREGYEFTGPWKPSIFMPRAASRISGTISEIRVERLNEISEKDAIAEGIEPYHSTSYPDKIWWKSYSSSYLAFLGPIESYQSLWESINGPGSWDLNPWVFVYTLKQEKTK